MEDILLDRVERLEAEIARLKAERDRLFEWAVDCEQIDNNDYNSNYFHPRERAIEAILMVVREGDGPDGATLDALNDHDRRATT